LAPFQNAVPTESSIGVDLDWQREMVVVPGPAGTNHPKLAAEFNSLKEQEEKYYGLMVDDSGAFVSAPVKKGAFLFGVGG
jgi:hypothetical protein